MLVEWVNHRINKKYSPSLYFPLGINKISFSCWRKTKSLSRHTVHCMENMGSLFLRGNSLFPASWLFVRFARDSPALETVMLMVSMGGKVGWGGAHEVSWTVSLHHSFVCVCVCKHVCSCALIYLDNFYIYFPTSFFLLFLPSQPKLTALSRGCWCKWNKTPGDHK